MALRVACSLSPRLSPAARRRRRSAGQKQSRRGTATTELHAPERGAQLTCRGSCRLSRSRGCGATTAPEFQREFA